jgi:hypothetical protein
MIKNIKKDLEELQGAEVKIFGQATTLEARSDDDITVDILELVEALADYEITDRMACKLLHVEDADDIDDLDYFNADNSYNWGGNVSHDFDYKIFRTDNNDAIVSIKFHRYGDVRGNYTETAFLLFEEEYLFHEIVGEQVHDFYIVVDKLEFSCTSRIADEYVRCSAKTNTGYIDLDVFGCDKYDVLTELVNKMEAIA